MGVCCGVRRSSVRTDISTRSHEDQNGPPFDERMDRPAPAGCYVSLILCPADNSALQSRVDAIEEIIESNTYHMEKLRSLLVNMARRHPPNSLRSLSVSTALRRNLSPETIMPFSRPCSTQFSVLYLPFATKRKTSSLR
jgi:hypothetical protein